MWRIGSEYSLPLAQACMIVTRDHKSKTLDYYNYANLLNEHELYNGKSC
jgi:hypothetical protein